MLLEELVLPLRTDNALFKAGIATAAAGVAALVAGMGLAIKATFEWAGELDSIQDIMGVTNKQAAALNFVLRKSGTDTTTLTKGMTILEKGLIKANGQLDVTGKALKAWGINIKDANGNLKNQAALVDDISDKYDSFSTQQERVNFLTEVFGRSGAELVDFFDTLAQEGSIDLVAEKVERLGLAIDPNRYEQFNRNLEELKLIGLGLAVGFTEKVMPAIEGFLKLISDPSAIEPSKILTWADTTIGVFLKGLGDSIEEWNASGGPEQLTEDLVSWIENIGDSEAVQSKTQIGAEHLVKAIGEAFQRTDFTAIFQALDDKFAKDFSGLDRLGFEIDAWLKTSLTEKFRLVGPPAVAALSAGLSSAAPLVQAALHTIAIQIQNKLTDIAKEFYNRAQGWVNQAVQGFNASKGRLLTEIGNIVTSINAILKKIITSFTLRVNLPAGLEDLLGGLFGGGGTTGTRQGTRQGRRRASGGPVIAGQTYQIAEFSRPERFTPNVSGRVDAMGGETIVRLRREDINEFATVIAHILPAELQKVRG